MVRDALIVLMVEDSPGDAEIIRDMLARARTTAFHVKHVERLGDGLDYLRQRTPDVVLLDFGLPDCRGNETYRRVRAVAPHVPVIILTNQNDETMAVTAVRDGAQDYLLKREVDANLLERGIRYAIERKAAEEALRESEERYALAVQGASVGLWDWNIGSGDVYYSPRWKAIAGIGGDAAIAAGHAAAAGRGVTDDAAPDSIDTWLDRVHVSDRAGLRHALDAHLTGDSTQFEYEYRLVRPDGGVVWVASRGVAVRSGASGGPPLRMAGSMTDISARKAAEERLVRDALHDGLTDLPNRNLFLDRLDVAAVRTSARRGAAFAVLFIDLDRFKSVNDSLGHGIGDALLVAIADRIQRCLRGGDTLARIGGDEFAVLLNDIAVVEDAMYAARRIHAALEDRFVVHGHEIFTSASIGVALSTTGYDGPEDLLRDADIAMYRAKQEGRARCVLFDRRMHQRAVALLKLETDLRKAIDRREFLLHYQPIVNIATGALSGFEALIRWRHPDGRLISPREFVPLAEETGLSIPMGWWVLQEACRQMHAWHGRDPGAGPKLSISVNFSGRMFAQEDMLDRVKDILRETRLDPRALRLEITENIAMDHGDAVLSRLADLRDLGIQLHLDDFGTGFSSLSYLQRFHYDSLKIDRTFVWGLGDDADAHAIVSAVLALGRHLRMNVIAEGVETRDQLARLEDMGCEHAQGFLFAPPLEATAATEVVHNPRSFAVPPQRVAAM